MDHCAAFVNNKETARATLSDKHATRVQLGNGKVVKLLGVQHDAVKRDKRGAPQKVIMTEAQRCH